MAITSDEEHTKAMARIDHLMDVLPKLEQEFKALADEVWDYEQTRWPLGRNEE